MAYNAPASRTTNDLITAVIWNADLKDNIIALYAGSKAIASQAALDFIFAASATQEGRLAKGTALQSIRMNAAASAYEFYSPKVVQIVAATYNTETSNSSAAYADTGLTATITPTSASNNVLVIVQQTGLQKTSDTYGAIKLKRGSTDICAFEKRYGLTNSVQANGVGGSGCVYLDNPATTSAVTYKTQFASVVGTSYVAVQMDGSVSTIMLMEVTP